MLHPRICWRDVTDRLWRSVSETKREIWEIFETISTFLRISRELSFFCGGEEGGGGRGLKKVEGHRHGAIKGHTLTHWCLYPILPSSSSLILSPSPPLSRSPVVAPATTDYRPRWSTNSQISLAYVTKYLFRKEKKCIQTDLEVEEEQEAQEEREREREREREEEGEKNQRKEISQSYK